MKETNRFNYSEATAADSKEILEILEESAYEGNVSLLYTRRDNAFQSLQREGEDVSIITCRDRVLQRIAAIGVITSRKLWVNGEPTEVGYLFSLKARHSYRKIFRFLHHGYAYFNEIYHDKGLPFFIQTVLEENRYAIKLFEKRRAFMPDHYPLGTYDVFAIKTGLKPKHAKGFTFDRCQTQNQLQEVVQFLNDTGKQYQFFPYLQPGDFQGKGKCRYGLGMEDIYILRDSQGQIAAAGAVWDQQDYKQYIIKGYKGIFNALAPVSAMLPVFGFPHMLSEPGTVLNFFTLSFWGVRNGNTDIFQQFIREISAATKKDYRFMVLGIHRDNPQRKAFRRIPHFKYSSKVFLVDWNKTGKTLEKINTSQIPYLECGTL